MAGREPMHAESRLKAMMPQGQDAQNWFRALIPSRNAGETAPPPFRAVMSKNAEVIKDLRWGTAFAGRSRLIIVNLE